MEEGDLSGLGNEGCVKRVDECSQLLNRRVDGVLVLEDSVADSPVFSVESILMDDTASGDVMVPTTPHSNCEGVDCRLGLNDSPSPPAFLNQQCKGGDLLEVECDSPSPPAFLNQQCKGGDLLEVECDSPSPPAFPNEQCKGGDLLDVECDSPSSPAFQNQQLLDFGSQCKDGVFFNLECDFLSPISSSNQQLILTDSRLEDGGFSSEDNPLTPKKDVFDPFAPGPEKLNWAPYRGKRTEQSKTYVSRKLKFDLCTKFPPNDEDLSTSEEEKLFQLVYTDLLEVIISTQTEESGKIPFNLSLEDGCQTPTVLPLLTGIADTCPGAPIKTSNKFIKIDKELCRKLEF